MPTAPYNQGTVDSNLAVLNELPYLRMYALWPSASEIDVLDGYMPYVVVDGPGQAHIGYTGATTTTDRANLGTVIDLSTYPSIVTSGTYTPTLTNGANVAASTAYVCQYMRVDNTVTVSGKVDLDPTTTGMVAFTLTLPVASNIANYWDVGGSGVVDVGGVMLAAQITGNASTNTAAFKFYANNTANQAVAFSFSYRVI